MTITASRNRAAPENDPGAALFTELPRYLDTFLALQEALYSAAILFRDTLYLNVADCNEIVQSLRDVRRTSTHCHQFWLVSSAAGLLHPLLRNRIRGKLGFLQGESTATPLLQVDMFNYLLITIPGTLRDADRIRLHVRLETQLTKKASAVRSLMTLLHENLGAAHGHFQSISVASPSKDDLSEA